MSRARSLSQIFDSIVTSGWSPVYTFELNAGRVLMKLTSWVGGSGIAPTTNVGKYVSDGGYTTSAASALDFRGALGSGAGDVGGPDGGVANNDVALFNGTTGKIIKGGGQLGAVALSNSYDDLDDQPSLFEGTWTALTGKPTFAAVALSGSWADITQKPVIGVGDVVGPVAADINRVALFADITGKLLKQSNATLANVAFTGDYGDLLNKPAVGAGDVGGPNGGVVANQVALFADTTGKVLKAGLPLHIVATSGAYTDLTGRPSFAAIALSGSWTDLINVPAFSSVATSGSWNDLANRPTIPGKANATLIRQAQDDASFITPRAEQDAQAFGSWTDQATITIDFNNGRNQLGTIGGNRTVGIPANAKEGLSGYLYFVQDQTGSRTLTFTGGSGGWKFPGGTAPVLSTLPGAVDRLRYIIRNRAGVLTPECSVLEKDLR